MARLFFQFLALQLIFIVTISAMFQGNSKKIQGQTYEIQQKVLTLGSSFTIKNDKGQPVYKVNFNSESFSPKLRLNISRSDSNN